VALPQLRPLVQATILRNRDNPVSGVGRPATPATADTTHRRQEEVITAPQEQALAAAEALEGASAQDIIRWATDTFGDRICITSSMTDAVIIHLASKVRPGIDVVFLDTGYHFAETIGTRDAVSSVYPVNVINVTPAQTVAQQDEEMGPRLYSRNPDLCCYLRKVVPLEKALEPYDAWLTGVRREETSARSDTRAVQWDARREMVKVNPIVDWTQDQVDAYIAEHGVLVNPLVSEGYPSIGCATCTSRVEAGGDARSGRWAGTGKTECGIHI
jgi:phosphoadenosine phosphosulfate reductase